MNCKKVQICLDKGYRVTISDISAAAVNPKMHALLLKNLPPQRLVVLAAQAIRAQVIAVSGNAISIGEDLLEDGLITNDASDML